MGKASRIVVLCEDKLQDVVVCRFLKQGWGVSNRDIEVVDYPATGSGSGEQHVRKEYPRQLTAFRRRVATAQTVLIAVVDADNESVKKHHDELVQSCQQATSGIAPRGDGEAVVHIIPKRHMETWLAYLDGVDVDETTDYKRGYSFRKRESDCHGLVDELAKRCKNRISLTNQPDSLSEACNEFDRIRDLL